MGIWGYCTEFIIERSKQRLFNTIWMAKLWIRMIESLEDNIKKSLANVLKAEALHVNKVNNNLYVIN